MVFAMNDSLPKLLLRRSEAGPGAVLWGREAQPYFGRVFDGLLSQGLLKERAPAKTWPACAACDAECGEREIVEIGTRLVAECPEDHRRDTVLDSEHLRSFEIDPAALCRRIARESGLAGEPAPIMAGLWALGRLPNHRHVLLALDPVCAADPRLVTMIRTVGEPFETSLLLPSGTPVERRQDLAEAGLAVVLAQDAFVAAGFALSVEVLVPSLPGEVRLIIGRGGRTVTLDRREKKMGDQAFKVLVRLAELAKRDRGFLTDNQIALAIYGDQILPKSRETKDVIRLLRNALANGLDGDEAKAARELIENQRDPNRYRLALRATEIALLA
jgi:hypothetical protein